MPLKIPKATKEDYIAEQGGMPEVARRGKLTIVTHNYPGGKGMVVSSHINHGKVTLDTPNGSIEFKADLLRRFHGLPCETQSLRNGGESYPRENRG
ncbi:MAG: hypothetical protein AAB685_02605 [Patescibacteria group bacterium]